MTQIKARPGESFESLWHRFKKAVDKAGILSDYKKNEVYEKPSVQRKKKQAAARKRALKREQKLKRYKDKNGSKKLNFKWNKDHTKKIPLRPPKNKNRTETDRSRPDRSNKNRNFNKPRTKKDNKS